MSNPEVWRTWEGRTVDGKFPLRQWLGGSDHSAVFLTERPGQASQKAAIKLVAASTDAGSQVSQWRAAAQLSHPNLISIYESGRSQMDGTPLLYVVMEFAEEDLSQILPLRPLAPAEVTDLLPPLLDALSYLHGKGLVHRRIMPSNILAVGDLLKLSSDQVAAPAESGGEGRRRDVYDAPETAAGIVSPAGDLWSVGATLITALTQKAPFADDASQVDVSRGNLAVPKSIPEPFRGIARECLHLDPKRRCSIAEIQARLQPAGRSVPDEAPTPEPSPRNAKRGPVVIAALLAVLIIGFVVLYSRGKKETAPVATTTEQPATQVQSHAADQVVTRPAPQAAPAAAPAPPVREPATPVRKATAALGDVVHQVLPDVPQSAKNTITGTIKVGVRVEVDASGKVTAAKLSPAGPSKYFANLALRAAERWEFSAPVVNGQPMGSTWILKFRFKRSSTQVSPERVSH